MKGVIGQNDYAPFVGELEKARNRFHIQIVKRGENLGGIAGYATGDKTGNRPHLGAGIGYSIDLFFHGSVRPGLVPLAGDFVYAEAGGIMHDATDALVVRKLFQALGRGSDAFWHGSAFQGSFRVDSLVISG